MDLKVKEYVPKGRKRVRERYFSKKRLRIFLFVLAGVLFSVAAVVFIMQWFEGETAAENAQALLDQSGIQAVSPYPSGILLAPADTPGDYEQPESPDADNEDEIKDMLKDLDGYTVIARLDIESLGIHLPVLSVTSSKALKVSVCYYSGPVPGKDGNLVITGHNYRNGTHFGTLDKIKDGNTVTLTDIQGDTYEYTVYKVELINPDEVEKLHNTKYPRELTLLTCESHGNRRLVVRCRADGI